MILHDIANSFNQRGFRIKQVYINRKSDEPLKKCITINYSLNSLDLSNSAKKKGVGYLVRHSLWVCSPCFKQKTWDTNSERDFYLICPSQSSSRLSSFRSLNRYFLYKILTPVVTLFFRRQTSHAMLRGFFYFTRKT
jgi:hypothetical protein